MKKLLVLILTLILTTLSLTSCVIPYEEQVRRVDRLQKDYQSWIINNFNENEETFNKIIENFIQYYYNNEEYEYEHVSIFAGGFMSKGYYTLKTQKYEIAGDKKYSSEEEDFLDTSLSYNITMEDLAEIFLDKNDYSYDKSTSLYRVNKNVIKYLSFSFRLEEQNDGEMWLCFSIYNKGIELNYTKSGKIQPVDEDIITVHKEYWINENWYIRYYFA